MEKAAERSAKVGEVRRLVSEGATLDAALLKAVEEMERGLVDADLGGGVYKKRVALPGRGKSGSVRTLVATNKDDRWFFLFGFEKNERENITQPELVYLRSAAQVFLAFSDAEIAVAVRNGDFLEVSHDNE